jgi:iron complex outermembrane recepter protein
MVIRILATLIVLAVAATPLFAQEQVKQDQGGIKTEATVTQPGALVTKSTTTAPQSEAIITKPATTALETDSIVTKPAATAQKPEEKSAVKKEEKVTELKEVVVTATRTEKGVADAPGDVHVVTAKDIEKRNIKTIDEALNTTAGVFNRRGKGIMDTLAAITIRGVPGSNRSLILRDGIPINSAYTGDPNWGGSTGAIKQIEVVEGPVSSLYGGYAMGGVVNIITKMPEKQEAVLNAGYGTSWNRGEAMDDLWRTYVSYGDRVMDKLSLFVSYGYQTTNGFPTTYATQTACPGGTTGCMPTRTNTGGTTYIIGDKGNNGWWDDAIAVKAAYDFSKVTKLQISAGRTRSAYDYGTPNTYLRDALGNPVYSTSIAPILSESAFLSGYGGTEVNNYTVSFETEIASAKTKFNFGLNDVQRNWYTTPGTAATINGGAGKLSSTPSQNYYTDLQATFPVFTVNLLTIGTSFTYGTADNKEYSLTNWQDESSKGAVTYHAGGSTYTASLFLQDEISILKNLTAYAGLRGDWWTTADGFKDEGTPVYYQQRSNSALSPKLSFVYKPFEQTTVRTSGGMAFRPPTVYELYRTWLSGTTTYKANPELKPETLTSWDVSVEQGLWKGAKIKGTYFENYFEDMIYRRTNSATEQEWVNAGRAVSKGGVVEAEQKMFGVKLFANATLLTESRIKSNTSSPTSVGKKITYLPEEMYNVGAEYAKGFFSGSLTWRYAGKLFRNDKNDDVVSGVYTSQDPYSLVDAKIGFQITKFAKISFAVDNIFNEKYYAYYRCPGRSWYADMTIYF